VNAGLHVANALTLYLLLIAMTGAIAPSLFVAAAFALHPLHVESVAWVAERKDLLSTFFGLLALCAWVGWTRRGGAGLYAAALAAYAVSLASKPMLVTLPALMILLDAWPLGRLGPGAEDRNPPGTREGSVAARALSPSMHDLWRRLRHRLAEKAPFAALAAVSAAIAILAQSRAGAAARLDAVGVGSRLQNALVSYASYLFDVVHPADLGVLYPLRERIPIGMVAGSALLLAALTILAMAGARRRPWIAVGWLWYLISLVPVIGLIQVGVQSRADRYTYLPIEGLFIMAAWGLPGLFASAGARRVVLAAAATLALLLWAFQARAQLGNWRDSVTLYTHALAVDNRNPFIHYNLADSLAAIGRMDESVAHYRAALADEPEFLEARNNLGNALRRMGRLDDAIAAYQGALYYDPAFALAHDNLGLALADAGRFEEAAAHEREALRLDPTSVDFRRNLGRAQYALGQLDEAASRFRAVLDLEPADAEARYRLGNVLAEQGRLDEALAEYERSIHERPDAAAVHIRIAGILALRGRTDEAGAHYCRALRLDPHAVWLARAGARPASRAALEASLAPFWNHCPPDTGTRGPDVPGSVPILALFAVRAR
jgi:tetratricopeptide (TPR) repeat protein